MRTGPTSYQTLELLKELEVKARESNFWRRVADDLKKSTRQRREVNIYKIEQHAREGEMVLVPGKVLSVGELKKKVDVAAFKFSSGAEKKIVGAKGRALSIQDLLKENPQGKKVRILG